MITRCPALEWVWAEKWMDGKYHEQRVQVHGGMDRPPHVPSVAEKRRCNASLEARVTIVMSGVGYNPVDQTVDTERGRETGNIVEVRCRYGHEINRVFMEPEKEAVDAGKRRKGRRQR